MHHEDVDLTWSEAATALALMGMMVLALGSFCVSGDKPFPLSHGPSCSITAGLTRVATCGGAVTASRHLSNIFVTPPPHASDPPGACRPPIAPGTPGPLKSGAPQPRMLQGWNRNCRAVRPTEDRCA